MTRELGSKSVMTATSETSVPRSSRPKRRWRLRAHLWRLVLIFSFLLISNRFVLSIVGVFNRFFPVIKAVFLAYPASEEMFRRYTYFGVGEWARWRPALIGVFDQQGSWGRTSPSRRPKKTFEPTEAAPRLEQLYARMEALRKAVGAEEVRFAGVLPGRLSVHGRWHASEAEVDAAMAAAMRGEAMVRAREKIDADAPVIVLDANSFIGQRLLREARGGATFIRWTATGSALVPPTRRPGRRTLSGKPADRR